MDAAASTGQGQYHEGTTSIHKKHPREAIPQAPINIPESIMLEGHHIQGRREKRNVENLLLKEIYTVVC